MGFFSSEKKTTSSVDRGPWKVQQPFIEDTFQEAQSLYDQSKAQGPYTGEFYAGMTPQQKSLLERGIQNAGTLSDTGLDWVNSGTNMINTGSAGVTKAADGLYNMANMDMVGTNIANAQKYASGYDLDALTKAATYAGNRNAAENAIPNLYRKNAASGNMNSDRAALSQGVVERGLAENAQNIYSNLAAKAYSEGLNLSQNDLKLMAANLAQSGDLYGSMADSGLSMGRAGADLTANADKMGYGFASEFQKDQQGQLDADRAKYEYNSDRQFQNLAKYYGIVGSQNWGEQSTSVSKEKSTPSGMQIASSIIGSIGSLFGG
jgi:hypothetical protein